MNSATPVARGTANARAIAPDSTVPNTSGRMYPPKDAPCSQEIDARSSLEAVSAGQARSTRNPATAARTPRMLSPAPVARAANPLSAQATLRVDRMAYFTPIVLMAASTSPRSWAEMGADPATPGSAALAWPSSLATYVRNALTFAASAGES